MTEGEHTDEIRSLLGITGIRKRPAMYIGDTSFFGFIQYVVSAFNIMLDNGATWITIEPGDDLRITSDAHVPLHINHDGLLEPFEAFGALKLRHLPDATILTALSDFLSLKASDGKVSTEFTCDRGDRKSLRQFDADGSDTKIEISFRPDDSIFSVTQVSPAVLHSYCRRISCLHQGISFRIKSGSDLTEYRSDRGIFDFFTAITTPYQILHQPIHIREAIDDLMLEAVFVFHSWTENRIWSFANKGRVPDGGTHEAGLLDAVARLHTNMESTACTGILAVLAIEYPHVTYEGCIKARIGNPELRDKVSDLVSVGLQKWASENSSEMEYLKVIDRFRFADSW